MSSEGFEMIYDDYQMERRSVLDPDSVVRETSSLAEAAEQRELERTSHASTHCIRSSPHKQEGSSLWSKINMEERGGVR